MGSQSVVEFFNNLSLCTEFREDIKVSREDMKEILEVARLSPSSFGLEPWKFLVIENKYIIRQIYRLSKVRNAKNSIGNYLVLILSRNFRDLDYDSDYVRYIMEEVQEIPRDEIYKRLDSYKIFLEEDYNINSDANNLAGWVGKQSYIPLTNMIIAAHKMGISTCAIEGFRRRDLEDYLSHENLYDKNKYNISCILSFGYGMGKEVRNKRRRPFEEVVSWIK